MERKKVFGIEILRNIAIISIIIYHINVIWLTGGFIGVDLFFVISGYLLSASLVRQYRENGNISIKDNLVNRLKQLWPVIFIVVFFTTIFITLFNKTILEVSYKDIFPSLSFTHNWWLIINKVGYFDSHIISPYKHLWYISVLMQSYIIIILTFKLSIKIQKNKNFTLFKIIMILFAIASFVMFQILYNPEDVSRVYYGTDSRIFEIIIGVLIYFYFPLEKLRKKDIENVDIKNLSIKEKTKIKSNYENRKIYLPLVGLISFAIYIFLAIYVKEVDRWIYRVGFLLFAVNSGIMLISIGNDNNIITYIFSKLYFLSEISNISYSLYLWHFPIIVLTQQTGEMGNPNTIYTILRLLVIFIASIFTYNLFEKNANIKRRKNRLKSRRERIKSRSKQKKSNYANVIKLVAVLIFILGSVGIAMPFISTLFVKENKLKLPDEIKTGQKEKNDKKNNKSDTSANIGTGESGKETKDENANLVNNFEGMEIIGSKEEKKNSQMGTGTQMGTSESGKKTKNEDKSRENFKDGYKKHILIGDSLAVNVGEQLLEIFPDMTVDAKISRQLYKSAEVVRKYSSYDSKDTALIIMLGTNGTFSEKHLDELIESFPNSKKIFVNIKAPEVWEKEVNKLLADYTKKHAEISLVDWYSLAVKHPEYFYEDNTHLVPKGVDALVKLILKELKS